MIWYKAWTFFEEAHLILDFNNNPNRHLNYFEILLAIKILNLMLIYHNLLCFTYKLFSHQQCLQELK